MVLFQEEMNTGHTDTYKGTGVASNYSCSASINLVAWDVDIDVTSEKAGVSVNPPPFAGGQVHAFNPAKRGDDPNPDKHFVVFYKDVIDEDFVVEDFNIKLKASVKPQHMAILLKNPRWEKLSGPDSGEWSSQTGKEVNYKNPKEGGVYRFEFTADGFPPTEFSVVLPLAGAEMDGWIKADMARADKFAAAINERYGSAETRFHWVRWFWFQHAGDYTGRPDNVATPTVWLYNQVVDKTGFGAFCTWNGRPVRLTKPSNFIIGYAMQQIGIDRDTAQDGTKPVYIGKEPTDRASVGAGWDVANGGDYDTTVSALVDYIWTNEKENDKVRKVWPNPNAPDNYESSSTYKFDYNLGYGNPGFLYMRE